MGGGCSHCGEQTVSTGTSFRAPRKTNIRAWTELKRVWQTQKDREVNKEFATPGRYLYGFRNGGTGHVRVKGEQLPKSIRERAHREYISKF